ncbi:MAG: biotin/lipoyl-binding protein [Clostridiales bacterium]|nr:biotin/lipoyl-binding protein [Clostridiales bacterium]
MKKYKITVDGKAYEVEVEEMGKGAVVPLSTVGSRTTSAPGASETKPAAASSDAKEQPNPSVASADSIPGEKLPAPMPGTILSVSVSAGQSVKKGEVLLVLEAMKMENEIVAHKDGVINGVFVQKGSSVNAGDPLVAFA